jgi:hypothetical protein
VMAVAYDDKGRVVMDWDLFFGVFIATIFIGLPLWAIPKAIRQSRESRAAWFKECRTERKNYECVVLWRLR